jgi:hypothetical protein
MYRMPVALKLLINKVVCMILVHPAPVRAFDSADVPVTVRIPQMIVLEIY